MEITDRKINRHVILKVKYSETEIMDTIKDALERSKNVAVFDPSGKERDLLIMNVKNIGGVLAEKTVNDITGRYATIHNHRFSIKESTWKEIGSSLFQIDHIFSINSKIKTLETRSSFSYKTKCPDNVITGAFSIIGAYTTTHKKQEIEKDFYAFVFFCLNPEKLINTLRINRYIETYFAGGATKDMFKDTDTLKQSGASYKIIKPITNGLDAEEFLKKLFE